VLRVVASDSTTKRQTAPSSGAPSRQHAARQRAVWRASLATERQDDSATTRRLVCTLATRLKGDYDIGCVVAIDNATRKVPKLNVMVKSLFATRQPGYGTVIRHIQACLILQSVLE
jgi:hypothetical protein